MYCVPCWGNSLGLKSCTFFLLFFLFFNHEMQEEMSVRFPVHWLWGCVISDQAWDGRRKAGEVAQSLGGCHGVEGVMEWQVSDKWWKVAVTRSDNWSDGGVTRLKSERQFGWQAIDGRWLSDCEWWLRWWVMDGWYDSWRDKWAAAGLTSEQRLVWHVSNNYSHKWATIGVTREQWLMWQVSNNWSGKWATIWVKGEQKLEWQVSNNLTDQWALIDVTNE